MVTYKFEAKRKSITNICIFKEADVIFVIGDMG